MNSKGLLQMKDIFQWLGDNNIISVLVEGGQSIFSQCVESKLFDEVFVIQAPKILGGGVKSLAITDSINLKLYSSIVLDQDCCINFRKEIIEPKNFVN